MREYPVGERRKMTAAYLKHIGWKAPVKGKPAVDVEHTGIDVTGATIIGEQD